jgi:hypothetical protein
VFFTLSSALVSALAAVKCKGCQRISALTSHLLRLWCPSSASEMGLSVNLLCSYHRPLVLLCCKLFVNIFIMAHHTLFLIQVPSRFLRIPLFLIRLRTTGERKSRLRCRCSGTGIYMPTACSLVRVVACTLLFFLFTIVFVGMKIILTFTTPPGGECFKFLRIDVVFGARSLEI